MTGNRSIFRFLMTLVFAALIASPQPMVASELSDNAGSEGSTEVTSTPSDDNTGDNPGDPGGDDTTGGDGTTEGQTPEDEGTEGESPEGQAPEGEGTEGETPDGQTPEDEGTEGETPDGQTPEDEGTEGEGAEGEGTEVQGPEKTNTDDDAKSIAPANIGGDFSAQQLPADVTEREYYCDFRNQPSQGSVADWWAADEVAPDCIDFEVIVSDATCSITVNMASWVYSSVSGNPFTWNDSFAWYETDSNGVVLRPEGGGPPLNWQSVGSVSPDGKSLTATFPEDHNGGTAYVLVNFGSPERDIEPGLSEYDVSHWRSTSAGVLYNVNTDCEEPVPVNYCDPAQRPAGMSIAQWLSSAPEGAMTDCLDVAVDLVGCGVLDASIVENRVVGYEYGFAWVEGEDISDPSTWNTTFPISFEEDYNGGSVVVTVFITGPEADYVLAGGSDAAPYAYANGGESFTLTTDCEEPVEVNYCDPAQRPAGMSIAQWLASAPEGAMTDCLDVAVDLVGCGVLDASIVENRVVGYEYGFAWVEGEDISDPSTWNTTFPISFPEDYNGGSVVVTVFITGPEADYVLAGGTDAALYAYANGGYSFTLETDCDVPLEVVTPELPTLVAATCNDDNEPVLPTLTVPETDGITYSEVTSAPANSVVLSLTATANDGYTFAGATMPEGWTLVSSSEALYEIVADEAECPTEDPTGTPTAESTGTPTPEDPKEEEKKDDKAAEVKELPSTGAGPNPASMIGLAATAAAAIAGAGIFFTNRKR